MKTLRLAAIEADLHLAAKFLSQDEVVALPTETVYGLAGNAFSQKAVFKIFQAKERPSFDPLIVHVGTKLLFSELTFLDALVSAKIVSPEVLEWHSRDHIESLLKASWPGPLTLVLPRGEAIPDEVTSGQNTVGVRCPKHEVFQSILNEIQFPLAAPSANRFGRISPTRAEHVIQELDGRIAAVVDGGACEVGVESTILQMKNSDEAILLRPGKISIEELRSELNTPISISQAQGQKTQAQVAPGMLDEHYAPRKAFYLFPHSFRESEKLNSFLKLHSLQGSIGYLGMFQLPSGLSPKEIKNSIQLSPSASFEEAAHRLFDSLRSLDENSEIDLIVADLVNETENTGLSFAIRDRLQRASKNKPL